MHFVRFGFLVAALFSVALVGCGNKPACPDGGTMCTSAGGGGGTGGCFDDTDCPDPNLFFCNTTTSVCEPSCRTKSNCTIADRGEMYALPFCDTGLGCQCDEGKCVGSLCGSDVDCGGAGQVCRNGACQAAPAASTVTKCLIVPDYAVLKTGAQQKFSVEAFDSSNNPVVLAMGVTWSAGAGGTVAGSGNSATFTAGTSANPVGAGVTATIGATTCSAQVETVDGNVMGTDIAVLVTDELTGRGISGATVIASDAAGTAIGAPATTGGNGYAKLASIAGAEVNVTVFSTNYNYLTIANYDTSAGASRFLSFVLRRNQTDKYGGQKGTFNNVPMTSNVHAAISGMSIAGSITDLSLTQLLGNTVPTRVKIGSAIDQMNVPLPAGVYLGFSDQAIKTDVSAQGLAGVCSAAKGGETAIAAGTCGTRSGWGLAGDVPLGDLPIDAFAGGVDNIMFDVVLARVIPIFRKFNSSIIRDVEFSLKATPLDPSGFPQFKDAGTEDFTPKNHEFQPKDDGSGSIPLAFNFVNRVPDLPKFRGSYVDGVVLLGGASVPGRGVVPLGLGVAVNSDGDAKTDKAADLAAAGLVQLRMAPTHHGVEGSEYGILALGVSFKAFTDSSAGVATSGIFAHPPMNKLAFDPTGATPLDLGANNNSFPVMPEGAKYNYSDTDQPGLTSRTFKIPAFTTTNNATTLVRVAFTDYFEHRWVVLADPAKVAGNGFKLPKPPGTTTDRTFANGSVGGTRSTMLVQTIRLSDPAAAAGTTLAYRALVEANNTNADRMTDFTSAFSFIDYSRPTIAWKTPTDMGTIAHGATAVVTVSHFKVGTTASDDGYVKVAFSGGTGCTEVSGMTDMSMGKGEINVTIPAACMGSNITATARLVDTAGNNLDPGVSSAITITVN